MSELMRVLPSGAVQIRMGHFQQGERSLFIEYTTIDDEMATRRNDAHGTFEIHITLDVDDPDLDTVQRFEACCAARTLKAILVGVWYRRRGYHRLLQSGRYVVGTFAEAVAARDADAEHFAKAGFGIRRCKIEAVASTLSDPDAFVDGTVGYYETHVVVALKEPFTNIDDGKFCSTDELLRLSAVADEMVYVAGQRRFVPLSFNLRKRECFVTVRTYGTDRVVNDARVGTCVATLRDAGFELVKTIREFVCFDSNIDVDSEQ